MSGDVQRGALADSAQAVLFGLLHQLVIRFLKEILKVDQMLEIFHRISLQNVIPCFQAGAVSPSLWVYFNKA